MDKGKFCYGDEGIGGDIRDGAFGCGKDKGISEWDEEVVEKEEWLPELIEGHMSRCMGVKICNQREDGMWTGGTSSGEEGPSTTLNGNKCS